MTVEETKKRAQEDGSNYQAVGFVYKEAALGQEAKLKSTPPQPEHPPTLAVDIVENEEDRFIMPKGLVVPGHIRKVGHLSYTVTCTVYKLAFYKVV